MTSLVADVGGTNTRLALVAPEGVLGATLRYPNADHRSFYDVLDRFCRDKDVSHIASCCVAVAGPVTGDTARLTNRNWDFSLSDIAAALPGGTARVQLVNDLAALGHSLQGLGAGQVETLRPGNGQGRDNGQALVVGLGTGVNICLAKSGEAVPLVIEAELGHSSLPSNIADALRDTLGAAAVFPTVEQFFAGRGLARLHQILSGGDAIEAEAVVNAALDREPHAVRALDIAAHATGLLARQMVFTYLPQNGLYLAGSVARGVLNSPARAAFHAALSGDSAFEALVEQVPLRLITDDAAALTGLARLAVKPA